LGVTAAQIFVGRESLIAVVYGLKTDKEFVNTLEDNIRERGEMSKLISNCAKAERSKRVKQILCALVISAWYSEPYHENQNFAENLYAIIKASTNLVMNFSGAQANTWLLAMLYVCLLMNHLASAALGWKSPEQVLTGQPPNIFKFLHFSFVSQCSTICIPTHFLLHPMRNKVGGLVLQDMFSMHGPTRFSPSNIRSFIAQLFGLPLILLSATSAFIHLEGDGIHTP
jgi:hypothetical protein